MTREDRARELQELKRACPERLIALYRSAAGLPGLSELPRGVSFAMMIESIIEHEASVGAYYDARQLKNRIEP